MLDVHDFLGRVSLRLHSSGSLWGLRCPSAVVKVCVSECLFSERLMCIVAHSPFHYTPKRLPVPLQSRIHI